MPKWDFGSILLCIVFAVTIVVLIITCLSNFLHLPEFSTTALYERPETLEETSD